VNQASINQTDVCATLIPVPECISEQAERLMELNMRIDATSQLRQTCHQISARAARLRQAILRKAFEGNLVPQDPNDEHASLMLERVCAARVHSPARGTPRKRYREVPA
jgi:type I restriction enzyme S subunit